MINPRFIKTNLLKFTIPIVSYGLFLIVIFIVWNRYPIEEILNRYGDYSYIAYIFVVILKFVFPVIPGQFIATLGGSLFGTILGFFYTMIGLSIGSSIAFFFGRSFHTNPTIAKIVNYFSKKAEIYLGEDIYNKLTELTGNRLILTYFLIYLAPGLPDDYVTFYGGARTSITPWKFIGVSIIARAPSYYIFVAAGKDTANINYVVLAELYAVLIVFSILTSIIWKKYLGSSKHLS